MAAPATWRVAGIANAHGEITAMEPWDTLVLRFVRGGVVLSSLARLDDDRWLSRDYRARRLDDEYYELLLPEPERRALLQAYCRYASLDRSWVEEGEPEWLRLKLKRAEHSCCVQRCIQLTVR